MTTDQAAREIEDGFVSTREVLGDPGAVANFFRVPGLLRQDLVEEYLRDHNVMTWSLDFLADDWTHISGKAVLHRALSRIEAKGKGILLLHDIQPATAAALPELLHQLKLRGFKIVHVVEPAQPGRRPPRYRNSGSCHGSEFTPAPRPSPAWVVQVGDLCTLHDMIGFWNSKQGFHATTRSIPGLIRN
jgi:hypothetical protein